MVGTGAFKLNGEIPFTNILFNLLVKMKVFLLVFSIQDSGIQSSMHDIRVDSPDGKGSPLKERRYNPAQYQDEVSVRL